MSVSFAQFDDSGSCIAMSATTRDDFERVEFAVGDQIKKNSDGDVVALTDDEIAAIQSAANSSFGEVHNRDLRNQFLDESDWVVVKAMEEGGVVDADWVTYRQALRDLPTHANWPLLEDADWPTQPA